MDNTELKPGDNSSVVEKYDQRCGKYNDPVQSTPTDRLLPVKQMPMAPEPTPYKLK